MHSIAECGFFAWLVILAAIVAIPIGATALILAINKKRTAAIMAGFAISVGMAPFACGSIGEQVGRSRVDSALEGGAIDPGHATEIREAGYAEARQCRKIGLGGTALPAGLAALGLVISLIRRDPDAPPIVPPR